MANVFDQFDTASSGNVFDQFDQSQAATPSIKPGDVEARRKQVQADAAKDQPNVVRERQSIAGEIGGGLQQTLSDLGTAFRPLDQGAKDNMLLDAADRAAHVGRSGLGVLRALAPIVTLGTSPMLTNLASKAGETVSDALAKRGHTTLADVLGALTSTTLDVAPQVAAGEAAPIAKAAIVNRFPNVAEKVNTLRDAYNAGISGLNSSAAAERKAAEDAAAAVRANAGAGLSSEESIAEAARQNAQKEAAAARTGLTTKGKVEALAKGDESATDVGSAFQKHYNDQLAESDKYFKPKYTQIEEDAAKIPTRAENYNETVYKIRNEGAPTGIASTGGERAASAAENALAENPPALRTGKDLIQEQRRLKDLERNAYSSGNDNLGRQYRELQQALGQDIEALPGTTAKDLGALNAEYAQKHVPFFGPDSEIRAASEVGPEAVVDKLVPKNTDALRGEKIDRLTQFTSSNPKLQQQVGDSFIKNMASDASNASGEISLSKLSSKWGQYADSRTGDKVLKATLGDRYEGMKRLVQNAEQASDVSVDSLLKEQLKSIDVAQQARSASYGQQVKELDSLKKVLGEGESTVAGVKVPGKAGSIETERLKKAAELKKEFDEKVQKLGVKPFPEHAGQLVGSAMILHGGVGALAGHSAAIAGAQALTGVGVMLAAPVFFKIISKAKGLELMNRAMRAAPGTAAAYSAARLIQKYADTELDNGKR